MTSTMRWVGLFLAIGLMGCTNSVVDQIESQQGDYARLDCACHWMEEMYASEDECVREVLSEAGFDSCDRRAYTEVPAYQTFLECQVTVNTRLLDCLRAARCDTAAETACYETASMESDRCTEPSEADRTRANDILAACRIGPPGTCPDAPISGSTGTIASGTTLGAGADVAGSCGGDEAPERAFTWTAPSTGTWTFDTNGSDYDTVLYAVTSCGGEELACDDDSGDGLQSQIVLELTAGQSVVLVVDGFNLNAGDFVLNVTGG